jgi:hypothetical protein
MAPKSSNGWGLANKGLSQLGDKMETTKTAGVTTRAPAMESGDRSQLPGYQKPSIRVMDEKEVLSAFQVTVAGISWWVG